MKDFNVMYNVGHAKYVLNYHDGIKKYADDSPFYDISIFKSKKALNIAIQNLIKEGYTRK